MKDLRLTLVLLACGAWGGFFLGRTYERRKLEPQRIEALKVADHLQKQMAESSQALGQWQEGYRELEARCK